MAQTETSTEEEERAKQIIAERFGVQ